MTSAVRSYEVYSGTWRLGKRLFPSRQSLHVSRIPNMHRSTEAGGENLLVVGSDTEGKQKIAAAVGSSQELSAVGIMNPHLAIGTRTDHPRSFSQKGHVGDFLGKSTNGPRLLTRIHVPNLDRLVGAPANNLATVVPPSDRQHVMCMTVESGNDFTAC